MKERHSFIYSWPAAEWQWGCSAVLGVVIHGVWCLLCYKWSSVSMECEHNIDKATLQHRYCNYLTSWLVYIKSCSQHILTVLLCEEYYHHHYHIPPPSPRPQAFGLLCSPHFCLSPHYTRGYQILPCQFPQQRNVFLWLDMWRQERLTQTVAAGTVNKPIGLFYWIVSFNGAVSLWDYLVLVTDK